jgi:membrane-associated phospholipid phosphatase
LHSIWRFLTDFGDTAVTVPLAIMMTAFLFAARQPRLAIAWAVVITGCAGATAALKLTLRICGPPLTASTLNSPSGHTAMSIAVYVGIAIVVGSTFRPVARGALFFAAMIFAVGIAASRTLVGYHSVIEVLVGLAVGIATLPVLMAVTLHYRPASLPLQWLAGGTLVVFALFHGTRWPAEAAIHHIAGWLDILRPYCR